MKQCVKFNLKSECLIVDLDGEYLVREGDFSPIIQPDDAPLSKEEMQKVLAEAKMLMRGNCLPFFENYLKDIGNKVFAYSLDSDGKYACGKTYRNATLIAAKNGAIKGCNRNKNKRGKKKPKSKCRFYAVGNKILLKAKDFGIMGSPTFVEKNAEIVRGKESHARKDKIYFRPSIRVQDLMSKHKQEPKISGLKETLKISSVALNKNLPTMIDEELRLDKVSSEDNKMIFNYTLVHYSPESMSASELKSLMYEDLKLQVCTDKDSMLMLKKGMLVDYIYSGKAKKIITAFSFDAKVCGLTTNAEQLKKNLLNLLIKK